ncbi:aminotransferase class I/II-fold pyridoxal phosphate-dependent enzyme [Chroococcidiopsis sp. CCNUC1]|uniref:aminotransferase class I/II-fold pyridoxal phosphate-dependent enzyme n=1 Tax=Chroococcidiopsis sp. CCNUC1 TaxID=2653189 RepID=UPI00201FC651|nr:aminotransferase class I/II-fold pyridoxal phosphate-dependent enzyme [Chroococcidiopsis sp. CCNUC1]URD49349.1 aminotransferase class I/II-fold pyridoxal phosphate-dependent enzyme [Chroococcidiopsis sp. CCNUC1]
MEFDIISQAKTPILEALWQCATRINHAPFYTPGHKRGEGITQQLVNYFGKAIFSADLPELPELDNLFAPQGIIQEAQELAAVAFGAEKTWFLVNGSTCGVEAAILATCGVGDKIILPRNVHNSAIAGLILSGAVPIFIAPAYDPVLDIAHSITPEAVAAALAAHPDAKAVLMVYPTYYGVCGDLNAIAAVVHQHNIPLLVDEAHGSHFAFHSELPTPALAAGADLSVQSTHKVLGALTQASMLHVSGNRIDRDRLNKSLQLLQSTSPSYLLLASLDAARQQMALYGEELMAKTLRLADEARNRISQIPNLSVLQLPAKSSGFVALDETRLTVTVSGLGIAGFEADEILHQELGVTAELPSLQNLTFIISLGNTVADIERLVEGFAVLAERSTQVSQKSKVKSQNQLQIPNSVSRRRSEALFRIPNSLLTPREAFFAPTETLPFHQTRDRISAELICPYPPGIPILMPGEIITSEALEYLQQIQASDGYITGCTEPSLAQLKVVKK